MDGAADGTGHLGQGRTRGALSPWLSIPHRGGCNTQAKPRALVSFATKSVLLGTDLLLRKKSGMRNLLRSPLSWVGAPRLASRTGPSFLSEAQALSELLPIPVPHGQKLWLLLVPALWSQLPTRK